MESTEPTLVPEWLRNSGNAAGGGASVHNSDVSPSAHSTQGRYFRSNSEKNGFLGRSLSSNYRHSLNSNGSPKHPYSSFTRSQRDKTRTRDKEKPLPGDIWDHDSDPLANMLTNRAERNALRFPQSMVSKRPSEVLPHRVEDSKNGVRGQSNGNGLLSGTSNFSSTKKASFEKDFPSLGAEEKSGAAGIKRTSSPGLGSAIQSLPIGSTGFLGGEKWTSALAEVPSSLANNGTAHPPLQHSTSLNSASGTSNSAGINMAEALSQPPARVHLALQIPDKSQRLEELAIKQSRQLIPVTPSMPKPLAPSSADKTKQLKVAVRTNEMNVASRSVQLQSHASHISSQSRAGPIRAESSSTSHVGKYLVLKPGRENGTTIGTKDASTPTTDVNGKVANLQLDMASPTPAASISPKHSVVSALETKAASLSLNSKSNVDKRLLKSLARSRSEFFNLMRRKTSPSAANDSPQSGLAVSSPSSGLSGDICKEVKASISSSEVENGSQICNGDGHGISDKTKSFSDAGQDNTSGNEAIFIDEEEAAFLRSLGWEENGGDDEGLTEEEINAFYQEYMNGKPSTKVYESLQPKCSTTSGIHKAVSGNGNIESSSSKSDSEA